MPRPPNPKPIKTHNLKAHRDFLAARERLSHCRAPPALQGLRRRFDVMALTPYQWPRHRLNVWRAD